MSKKIDRQRIAALLGFEPEQLPEEVSQKVLDVERQQVSLRETQLALAVELARVVTGENKGITSMVEAVACALAGPNARAPAGFLSYQWVAYVGQAKKAISALRDPTYGMIDAAIKFMKKEKKEDDYEDEDEDEDDRAAKVKDYVYARLLIIAVIDSALEED